MAKKMEVTNEQLMAFGKVVHEELKRQIMQWLDEEVATRVRNEVRTEVARVFREMGRL